MSQTSINTTSSYFAYQNILADINTIRKNTAMNTDADKKAFIESRSQDSKNTIVSEKPGEAQSILDYNLRLQQNTPAAKLLNTVKSFNETYENEKVNYKNKSGDFIELTETDDYSKVRNSTEGNGYYIVINDSKPETGKKNKILSSLDRWRERIKTTYHLGLEKQPGTLVNLVI